MSQNVFIDQRKVVDVYDQIGQAAGTDNAAYADLLVIRARSGYDARMAVGANVDPGAEAYVSFRVLVNGNPFSNSRILNVFTSAPASVTDPASLSVNMVEIPEGAYIQIQGKIAGVGDNTHNMYVRARIEYVQK